MKNRRHCLMVLSFVAAISVTQVLCAQAFPINLADSGPKDDPNVKMPAFDVVSVKPNKLGSGNMSWMTKPDGYACVNISLKTLIASAYGVRQDLVSGGPGWVESQGFDVDAKVAGEDVEALKKLTGPQRNSMLQPLLADRFKLKVHTETKILPTYDLVVAKGGPKLTEVPAADLADDGKDPEHSKHPYMMEVGPGTFKGQAMSLQFIANHLSFVLEKTVTDKTGLKGKYDIELKWTPEGPKAAGDDGSSDSTTSIFTAVQEQLGLKLVPAKGPVETLVIDRVELPTQN